MIFIDLFFVFSKLLPLLWGHGCYSSYWHTWVSFLDHMLSLLEKKNKWIWRRFWHSWDFWLFLFDFLLFRLRSQAIWSLDPLLLSTFRKRRRFIFVIHPYFFLFNKLSIKVYCQIYSFLFSLYCLYAECLSPIFLNEEVQVKHGARENTEYFFFLNMLLSLRNNSMQSFENRLASF